jgi:hypothetical protein
MVRLSRRLEAAMIVIAPKYQRGNLAAVKRAFQPFELPTPARTPYEQRALQST